MILYLILVKVSLKIDADRGSIKTIGDLIFNMGNLISLIKLKQLDFVYPGIFKTESLDNDLDSTFLNLKRFREKLSNNINIYSECEPIERLYKKTLKVNKLNGKFPKMNLVNYLKFILMHTEEFIKEVKTDGIGKNNSVFIEENFIETVKQSLHKELNMATGCISDNTYTIQIISISIIITQLILAFIYVMLMIPLIKSISNSFTEFSKVFHSQFQLKKVSLVNYCNNIQTNEGAEPEDSIEYPSNTSESVVSFHIKLFLLLIISIITISCTFVGITYLYSSDLAKKIHYTPQLKVNLISRKSIYKEIQYYSTKSYILKNNISQLLFNVNYTDDKADYVCTIRDYTEEQANLLENARKSEYKVFTSNYNTKTQLYTYSDPDHAFRLGTLSAGRSIVYDMLDFAKLIQYNRRDIIESGNGLNFLGQIDDRNNKLTSILDKLIEDLDQYSPQVL